MLVFSPKDKLFFKNPPSQSKFIFPNTAPVSGKTRENTASFATNPWNQPLPGLSKVQKYGMM